MKRHYLLILLFLIVSVLTLQAQTTTTDRILSQLISLPGVEASYIGPAAIRFAGNGITPAAYTGQMSQVISGITSIEVVECSEKATFPKIKKFTEDLVQQLGLELMLEDTGEDEISRIYCTPQTSDGDIALEGLLIESVDDDEYTLVFIKGKITAPAATAE